MTKQKRLRYLEYYNLQKCFDNLYEKSKQGDIFKNLTELISSEENIRLAYRNIKRNKGSFTAGTDGITIKDTEKISVEKYVKIIQSKLQFYSPKPVRRVEIEKQGGGTRPLGIPTMTDRIVQQCILQVLEPICEAKFHERNNGFRPNRSTENALAQCYRMIQKQNLHFVVDIDIKGFFDNVNHSKLIRQIWAMGIQDKKLICIIKQMLKAPIIMPDGTKTYPTRGTPQGGILSPLLSNIVLNELDWWITSQWESIPTEREYKCSVNKNGSVSKSSVFAALRGTNLKEMYIVRYADDFKIFCRKKSDAEKIFIAVRKWLKERLKLDISEEKSKVVNLRKHYSEFLGFKMKAVKKGGKYAVKSHMTDKAVKNTEEKLKKQIEKIQRPKDKNQSGYEIERYNQMVEGIQNYYRSATHITIDCANIQRKIAVAMQSGLKHRMKKKGTINNPHIKERYGTSRQLRFIDGRPLVPIGYVQTKFPMYKKKSICKYTKIGREELHKNLRFDNYVLTVMKQMLSNYKNTDSIEYTDNRISLYASQYGKCAILGTILDIDDIHCHHKLPRKLGGKDNYQNLVIVHKDIHTLVHAVKVECISKYLSKFSLNAKQKQRLNSLRKMAGNEPI